MVVKLLDGEPLNQKLGDRIESRRCMTTAQDSRTMFLPRAPYWRAQLFRR